MKIKQYVKQKFNDIKESVKDNVVVFGFTLWLFLLLKLELLLDITFLLDSEFWVTAGFFGIITAFCLTKFFEFNQKSGRKYLAINAALSIGVCGAWLFITDKAAKIGGTFENYVYMIYIGLFLVLGFLALYFISKTTDQKKMLPKIITSGIFSLAVATVVFVGLLVSILAFDAMIVSLDDLFEYIAVTALFCYIVIAINLFISGLPKGNSFEISKLFKVLALNIGLSLYLILIAILYLYLLIIVFTFEMPAGEINYYSTIATALFIFFNFALKSYSGKAVGLFYKYGKFIIIPIIFMQVIAIAIRASAYGFTVMFLISIVYVALSVCFVAFLFLHKKIDINLFFIVAAVLVFLFGATPLNVIDIATSSQLSRLESITSEGQGEYTNQQKNEIVEIFNYLSFSGGKGADQFLGRVSGESLDRDETFFRIFGFERSYQYDDDDNNDPIKKYNRYNYFDKLDTSGFDTIHFDVYSIGDVQDALRGDDTMLLVQDGDGTQFEISFDLLYDQVLSLIVESGASEGYSENESVMSVTLVGGGEFYIRDMVFYHDTENESYRVDYMHGYVLR